MQVRVSQLFVFLLLYTSLSVDDVIVHFFTLGWLKLPDLILSCSFLEV